MTAYLSRRDIWRVSDSQLLVSYVNLHKAVFSSTISRWIKDLLRLAGIDITEFTSHSTRSATTSKAKVTGVSIADIMSLLFKSIISKSMIQVLNFKSQFSLVGFEERWLRLWPLDLLRDRGIQY